MSLRCLFVSMGLLLTATVSVAQPPVDEETYKDDRKSVLELSADHISSKKVRTMIGIRYKINGADTVGEVAEFYAFDTSGRVLTEHTYSENYVCDLTDYTYDAAGKLKTMMAYAGCAGIDGFSTADSPRYWALERNAIVQRHVQYRKVYRNGLIDSIISYNRDGVIAHVVYLYNEQGKLMLERQYTDGLLQSSSAYYPSGIRKVDSTFYTANDYPFGSYDLRVNMYDSYGNRTKTRSTDHGKFYSGRSYIIKYDDAGHIIEHREVSEEEGIGERTVSTYSAQGEKMSEYRYNEYGDLKESTSSVDVVTADGITRTTEAMDATERGIVYYMEQVQIMNADSTEVVSKIVRYNTKPGSQKKNDITTDISIRKSNEKKDARGNIILDESLRDGKPEERKTWTYDSANHVTQFIWFNRDGEVTYNYTYHENGKLKTRTKQSLSDRVMITTYDADGQLIFRSETHGKKYGPAFRDELITSGGSIVRTAHYRDEVLLTYTEYTYTYH